jgi:LysM repeat protein
VDRNLFSRRWFVPLVLILVLALAACERQLQDDTETPATKAPTPAGLPVLPSPLPPASATDAVPPAGATPGGELPAATAVPDQTVPTQPAGEGDAAAGSTGQVSYVVQAGDTLFRIAQQYNITVEALAAANGISENDLLTPGQILIVPLGGEGETAGAEGEGETTTGEQTHIVQPGENLFRIGLRYGFTVAELAAYNGIANPNQIEVGQVIRIPPSE